MSQVQTTSAPLGAPAPARPQRWFDCGNLRIPGSVGARQFRRSVHDGFLSVILAREPHDVGDWRWHLSISHSARNPTWEEIAEARYDLLADDLTMAMYLPPRAEYVNVHRHCFHLFETGKERAS